MTSSRAGLLHFPATSILTKGLQAKAPYSPPSSNMPPSYSGTLRDPATSQEVTRAYPLVTSLKSIQEYCDDSLRTCQVKPSGPSHHPFTHLERLSAPSAWADSDVTKPRLGLLTAQQANKLRDELLGQAVVTLFRKPADGENVDQSPKEPSFWN